MQPQPHSLLYADCPSAHTKSIAAHCRGSDEITSTFAAPGSGQAVMPQTSRASWQQSPLATQLSSHQHPPSERPPQASSQVPAPSCLPSGPRSGVSSPEEPLELQPNTVIKTSDEHSRSIENLLLK
jgi:hypothetical protein